MFNIRSFLIVLVASFAISACGGRKAVDDDITAESVGGTAGSSGLDGSGLSGSSSLEGDLLNSRVIYFDYDSSNLTADSEAVVQAHAQYLSGATGVNIILEGHADERGTREYNLALGEDRGKAVANLMQALGVSSARIQTISYGEERPVSLGSDDSAWSLNRRVEILY